MKADTLRNTATWAVRLITGFTFILSGWAKAIDPWGFAIKAGEYLSVWHLSIPHEAVVTSCVALSCVEFCTGILLATGCLRRFSVWTATAMMTVMLPLTLYIALFDPVADCGCFGDFLTIPNWLTFSKNVVLTVLLIYLLKFNVKTGGLYPAPVQWMVITISQAFPLVLALAGYQIQPLIDFRPYRVGTKIFASPTESDSEETFTYKKGDEIKKFTLDNLPDSTWTFVEEESTVSSNFDGGIAVYDSDGYDIASDITTDGKQFFLIIPEPGMHYLTYAHYVNNLADYCRSTGNDFIAITGCDNVRTERWRDWCRPTFDVYCADATSLKQLVRGPEAVVYTIGGIIQWKRTLGSLALTDTNAIEGLRAPDDGFYHLIITGAYLLGMLIIYILGLSPKILRFFVKRTE